ncbi:glycosyltransferase family 9 protein [Mucilaginibacter phyllosphaerae]|uniref:Glycosyltransferase family 9 protein n=1 Tax=Mucilaginibacter phyllosphaerae TaxID=1812349 RepID=A0A4Y8AG36_9SPHI|nr:glycosyltransferase family 9 protein [Mucilaginibacter phyllosphaerae]MBB3968650.1 lipopolysaccharide heptosyltransferase II [Mucilaginibacter phyllosphaerae]TEW67713.1 glycosyltransferase family 9 protein [Mucilaginibacter phyllosphaerae]GGH14707.1 ADP-heptose--LPS heptosyltransferase [Mucilaginibacter phyllosphaerae]
MKILIRLPNWLGDVVMSTAFIYAVRQVYPDAIIDVIIKKELGGIASLIPGINNIHLFSKQDHKGLGGVYRFGKSLRAHQYAIFFNLPHSLSSFIMAWASGAKQRIGFNKEGGRFLLTRSFTKPANLHRVDEYVYLLEKFSGKIIANKQVSLAAEKPICANHTVIINFNSEAPSRRMPLDKGRNIINTLTNKFKHVNFLFIGSPKEARFIDELLVGLNHAGRLQNRAGKTNLQDLTSLMAGSKAVLTTDSGPAHLANALGIPTVVLFGAGNENNTAPYNKNGLQIIRYGQLTCEPCVRNTCKLYGIPKCMQMLDENKIIKALSLHLKDA